MIPHRIQAKLFADEQEAIALEAVVPVFHRWIQRHALDGLLIDVADYKHVPDGPGIVLIGHEADYGLERVQGRLGLRHTRKRGHTDALDDVLTSVLGHTLRAAHLLQHDPAFKNTLAFRTDALELVFADQLRVPNRLESLEIVRPDLDTALARLFGDASIDLTRVKNDPRQSFTLHLRIPDAADLDTLIEQRFVISK